MSLLRFLQFQPIDADSDRDEISAEHAMRQEIDLSEELDDETLGLFWDKVVQDIHDDPEWFKFSDE